MSDDRYLVILEAAADGSFGAYLPDIPGCVSCGDTIDEARQMIREAFQFHLASLRSAGLPIPKPTTLSDYVSAPID